MSSDASLLALIVDDSHALSVLAAWAAKAPLLSQLDEKTLHVELAELTSSIGTNRVHIALKRLHAARVLVDGGITELADKLLQSIVQSKISGVKRR